MYFDDLKNITLYYLFCLQLINFNLDTWLHIKAQQVWSNYKHFLKNMIKLTGIIGDWQLTRGQ
jgi:hypothetical protein